MTGGEKVVGRIAVFVVIAVVLFMGMRYVRSEGASAPELFARAAGVPADPCVLEGVECQDLPGGAQAYVGVFDAAEVQGRYRVQLRPSERTRLTAFLEGCGR